MIPRQLLQQGGYTCNRPFYDLLVNEGLFDWLACPYTIEGLGLTGLGLFLWAIPFVGLKNWSESWEVPLTWTAIVTPALAAGFLLPGGLLRRIAGILTLVVAMLIIGIYWWWGRA